MTHDECDGRRKIVLSQASRVAMPGLHELLADQVFGEGAPDEEKP